MAGKLGAALWVLVFFAWAGTLVLCGVQYALTSDSEVVCPPRETSMPPEEVVEYTRPNQEWRTCADAEGREVPATMGPSPTHLAWATAFYSCIVLFPTLVAALTTRVTQTASVDGNCFLHTAAHWGGFYVLSIGIVYFFMGCVVAGQSIAVHECPPSADFAAYTKNSDGAYIFECEIIGEWMDHNNNNQTRPLYARKRVRFHKHVCVIPESEAREACVPHSGPVHGAVPARCYTKNYDLAWLLYALYGAMLALWGVALTYVQWFMDDAERKEFCMRVHYASRRWRSNITNGSEQGGALSDANPSLGRIPELEDTRAAWGADGGSASSSEEKSQRSAPPAYEMRPRMILPCAPSVQ